MNTALALLAVHGKTRLTLREVAKELNISYNTARNLRAQKKFPIPMAGSPLAAKVGDVAKYLDSLEEAADGEANQE